MTRIEKKKADHWRDFEAMFEWFQDLRAYMLEAMDENTDLRIIRRQFKRRMVIGGRRNRHFSRTRLIEYLHTSIGNPRFRH